MPRGYPVFELDEHAPWPMPPGRPFVVERVSVARALWRMVRGRKW